MIQNFGHMINMTFDELCQMRRDLKTIAVDTHVRYVPETWWGGGGGGGLHQEVDRLLEDQPEEEQAGAGGERQGEQLRSKKSSICL